METWRGRWWTETQRLRDRLRESREGQREDESFRFERLSSKAVQLCSGEQNKETDRKP